MKKAIVIGATSGMGRSLALRLAEESYRVGIIGRRESLLVELTMQHPEAFIPRAYDISNPGIIDALGEMTEKLGGLDLLVVAAGVGHPYHPLNHTVTRMIVDTNIQGFTTVIDWGLDLFLQQGRGHLVSFSSIAGMRGSGVDPAYSASNSFKMSYVEGLQHVVDKTGLPVYVTDIRPGFVEKEGARVVDRHMILSQTFATDRIYRAIVKKKKVEYLTWKWGLVAQLMRLLPHGLYRRLMLRFVKPNGYGPAEVKRKKWQRLVAFRMPGM